MIKKLWKSLKELRVMNFTLLSNLFNRPTINNTVTVNAGGTLNQFVIPDKKTAMFFADEIKKRLTEHDSVEVVVAKETPDNDERKE
jgi:hypothetical protein